MKNHLRTSLVNSGIVTVCTSLAMTLKNSDITVLLWGSNWLVSWTIVFLYVYFIAPRIQL